MVSPGSNTETQCVLPSSFRDPAGFLFRRDNTLYRQVNLAYKDHYDHLMNSGLYRSLAGSGLVLSHQEVDLAHAVNDTAYKILQPDLVPFISYPYEWCFSQFKDAALVTLRIQKESLRFGMSLKDSSAYNIQFKNGKPVLIDTLSFEKYREGRPWGAYQQFCQHFLAPLALMSFADVRLSQLLRIYIDGVPLDLASSLLPWRTRLRFGLFSHIHLHAKSQKHFANRTVNTNAKELSEVTCGTNPPAVPSWHGGTAVRSHSHLGNKISRAGIRSRHMSLRAFLGLVDNLESTIQSLKWRAQDTTWINYDAATHYGQEGRDHKKQLVSQILDQIEPKPNSVWDLGANTGQFSRLASERGIRALSFDMDPACVERNYLECIQRGETHILPLLLDLTNPSPDLGWENQERVSVLGRGPADTVLALALVHHLAIANNLPLQKIAAFFARISNSLIIEFVPKADSQVQLLFASREDIFPEYTRDHFEKTFSQYFVIRQATEIYQTKRMLYWMTKIRS